MHDNALITIEKSQTLLLNEQSRLLESQGKTVYKFGFGQSPFSPPPAVVEALKTHAHEHYYSSVQGIPALREAVAAFHSAAHDLPITADKVFIGPGSKTLIYSIMACYRELEVLIPAPAWVSYAPQAHMLGHATTRVFCDYTGRWRVTPDALEQAVAERKSPDSPLLLILNYPGNPDGLCYTDAELQALAFTARKHGIIVISDEIYGMLHHDGAHVSLRRHYPEGTIITTGLSKWCGAGGWRLGVAILPEGISGQFVDTLLGVASEVYSCAPTPVQLAAIAAYAGGQDTLDYIRHQRRILKQLGLQAHAALEQAGIRVCAPEGGFYMFVDFMGKQTELAQRGLHSSEALCEQLVKDCGVVLLPSTAFGVPSEYMSARLAYVDFDGNAAIAASQAIGLDAPLPENFAATHCARTLEGIAALAQWVAELKQARTA